LAVRLTGANEADVTQMIALVDDVPPVAGKPGRPRRRPKQVFADRAYDSRAHREELRRRNIRPRIARRGEGHGSGLGVHRWVVERTFSWFHQFRRLRVRFERRADIHESLMAIGCALICWRFLETS